MNLNDAQQLHQQYPETFDVPPDIALAYIEPGDLVKLCFTDTERMWVLVESVTPTVLEGRLSNTPFFLDSLRPGDLVTFERRHVYDIFGPSA